MVGPLVFGEVLAGSNEPEHLSSWGLKVEVRIRHFQHLDAEGDNFLSHFSFVVGLQLKKNRLQEVVSHPKVVLVVELSRELAAQDVTVKPANSVLFRPPHSKRRMVSKNCRCHHHSLSSSFNRALPPCQEEIGIAVLSSHSVVAGRARALYATGVISAASAGHAATDFDVRTQALEEVVPAASALLDAVQLWC